MELLRLSQKTGKTYESRKSLWRSRRARFACIRSRVNYFQPHRLCAEHGKSCRMDFGPAHRFDDRTSAVDVWCCFASRSLKRPRTDAISRSYVQLFAGLARLQRRTQHDKTFGLCVCLGWLGDIFCRLSKGDEKLNCCRHFKCRASEHKFHRFNKFGGSSRVAIHHIESSKSS